MPTIEDLPHDGFSEARNIPDVNHMANPKFMWEELNAASFIRFLDSAHEEAVRCRKNCFRIPHGNAGKSFILELARLNDAFLTGSALESVPLKATMVLPLLVFQKSLHKSKPKDHAASLD